jgi:hypothetical protein
MISPFSKTDYDEVDDQEAADRVLQRRLVDLGHTVHCSFRILYGDGKCECIKLRISPIPRVIEGQRIA